MWIRRVDVAHRPARDRDRRRGLGDPAPSVGPMTQPTRQPRLVIDVTAYFDTDDRAAEGMFWSLLREMLTSYVNRTGVDLRGRFHGGYRDRRGFEPRWRHTDSLTQVQGR